MDRSKKEDDRSYKPYEPRRKIADIQKKGFDEVKRCELSMWNKRSEKLYNHVRKCIKNLSEYYPFFGDGGAIIQDVSTGTPLQVTESLKFLPLARMLGEYQTFHQNLSTKDLKEWDRIERNNAWEKAKIYEERIEEFFKKELKRSIQDLYGRGMDRYNNSITAISRAFPRDSDMQDKVTHLKQQVTQNHQFIKENDYLLDSLQYENVSEKALNLLGELKRSIEILDFLGTGENSANADPINMRRFTVISEAPSHGSHQRSDSASSATERLHQLTVENNLPPLQKNSREETTMMDMDNIESISDTHTKNRSEILSDSAAEQVEDIPIDYKQEEDRFMLSGEKRVKKEKIAKLMSDARAWVPGPETIGELLENSEFKSLADDKAIQVFKNLKENVLSNDTQLVDDAWNKIKQEASTNRGVRFGLRYLGGTLDTKTDNEKDLEEIRINTDNNIPREMEAKINEVKEILKKKGQESVRRQYNIFEKKILAEQELGRGYHKRPVKDAFAALKGCLSTYKIAHTSTEATKIQAEYLQKYLTKAHERIYATVMKDKFKEKSAIPKDITPEQALEVGLSLIARYYPSTEAKNHVQQLRSLLNEEDSERLEGGYKPTKQYEQKSVESYITSEKYTQSKYDNLEGTFKIDGLQSKESIADDIGIDNRYDSKITEYMEYEVEDIQKQYYKEDTSSATKTTEIRKDSTTLTDIQQSTQSQDTLREYDARDPRTVRATLRSSAESFFSQKGWIYLEDTQSQPEERDTLPLKAEITLSSGKDPTRLSERVLRKKFVKKQLEANLDWRAIRLIDHLISSTRSQNQLDKKLLEKVSKYILQQEPNNDEFNKSWEQGDEELFIIRNQKDKSIYVTNVPSKAEKEFNIHRDVFYALEGEKSNDTRGYEIGYDKVDGEKGGVKKMLRDTEKIHIYIDNIGKNKNNNGKEVKILNDKGNHKIYFVDNMQRLLRDKLGYNPSKYSKITMGKDENWHVYEV